MHQLPSFRNAMQVSPEIIARMDENDLNKLMRQLLTAQAYKCGLPISEVNVNTEVKAGDDGCDGWTGTPAIKDDWLGFENTCWQFKTGDAGEPAKLIGEVTKRYPKEVLLSGGRFVVIASSSTSGRTGIKKRRSILVEEAKRNGIPVEKIEVMDSEELANWCNQYPSIAAYWAGRPDGLWTLDDWKNSEEHQTPWQVSEKINSDIENLRNNLDFNNGDVWHVHVQGLPGIGKTRFALELCRDASWNDYVIYIPQADDHQLNELIQSVTNDKNIKLMIVADEVQQEQLLHLRNSIGRNNGYIRLITIGHCKTPDSTRIPVQKLGPLGINEMTAIIRAWFPAMPYEHINFIAQFSDGYVRLAKLVANIVNRNPLVNVHNLLNCDDIQVFLDRMLGQSNRRSLYVVSALTKVGWTSDKQNEGKTIANHFGLDWIEVCNEIGDFDRKFNIVPQGGRYRYISPMPLGNYLAVEAWEKFPEKMRSLSNVLDSEEAKRSYYERINLIASTPQVNHFAQEELELFFRFNDFLDGASVQRWAALSAANPIKAAHNIFHALKNTSINERKEIKGNARREIIWALTHLSWKSSSFYNAIKTLALLAEAENETWANNATGEFLARFQIFLGGTSVNYTDRLDILDELLKYNRLLITKLVIHALSQAGNQYETGKVNESILDGLPEEEWHPKNRQEYLECIIKSCERLIIITNQSKPEFQDELLSAANKLSIMLYKSSTRNSVIDLYTAICDKYPESRESIRRIIADIVNKEKKYHGDITPEELNELEKLQSKFEDSSIRAQLLQYVGPPFWDQETLPDLAPLAHQFFANPTLLVENWEWLTSGKAENGWRFGEELAKIDTTGILAEKMLTFHETSYDFRLICAYVNILRNTLENDWYDTLVIKISNQNPFQKKLLFEIAWRCGVTESFAKLLIAILRNQDFTPDIVNQLSYGNWVKDIHKSILKKLLYTMLQTEYLEAAIGILKNRIDTHLEKIKYWDELALQLVCSPKLISNNNQMVSYNWKTVADSIISFHAKEIAIAIFNLHYDENNSANWSVKYSDPSSVLHACVKHSPNEIWEVMQNYLLSKKTLRFTYGLPKGLIEIIPVEKIKFWIDEQPEERAKIISHLVSANFSNDTTIASILIGLYGDYDQVESILWGNYITGSWSGPSSIRWDQLADKLNEVTKRTSMPKLKNWASISEQDLRKMAERDRQNEEEEEI